MVTKRIKAFLIDYFILLLYIALLFGVTILISHWLNLKLGKTDPVTGEMIGFSTLTLPVIFYFILCENSKSAGTFGKQKLTLQVVSTNKNKAGLWQLLIRNCIKFFPWEMAHFCIYRLFYYTAHGADTPVWIMAGLIISHALAVIYVLFMIFNKTHRSVYELLSGTMVIQRK